MRLRCSHLAARERGVAQNISQPAQEGLLSVGTYGPVLESAAAKGTPEQQSFMVTAPANIKNLLIINEEQAGYYSKKYESEWNKFLLG